MKPILLECSTNIYKFKLPFSVLIKLRDDNIDFISGEAWGKIENEVGLIYPIIRRGVSYAEAREVSEEEVVGMVDDLMETIGFSGVYEKILNAISIKGAYKMEEEPVEEVNEIEEDVKKKK